MVLRHSESSQARTSGCSRSSALSCSPRAMSAGSVRSRTASSATRTSSWWRSSWSGSPATSARNPCTPSKNFLKRRSSMGSGTHHGDCSASFWRSSQRFSSRQAGEPAQRRVEQRLVVPAGHRRLDHPGHAAAPPARPAPAAGSPVSRVRWMSSSPSHLGQPADQRAGVGRQPVRVLRLGRARRRAAGPRPRPAAARTARPGRGSSSGRTCRGRGPSWSLRFGMIAVWGMGKPSGCRKSAVTANQSASAPTMAASAVART